MKKPGAIVDELYLTRERRLELDRQAEALKEKERDLKDWLINNLSKQELSRLAGAVGQVSLKRSAVGKIEDPLKFQAYVKKKDAFDLYQKRLNLEACRLRWDAGEDLPGVEKTIVIDLTVSRAGAKAVVE